ncbi:hypothetical protein LWC35_07600 [Pseudonocardia kujensis]|nr:hypothetical protein [Pseudonocardia kujensis]
MSWLPLSFSTVCNTVVGRNSVTMFWVSQNPVIIAKTCRKLRPLGPVKRFFSGADFFSEASQISDSET